MKKCYLCGENATTKDHLPPKSFFPRPAPSNLITAPCCAPCNNQFSHLDEKFRVLASTYEHRNKAGLQVLEKKVFSPNSMKGKAFLEIANTLRPRLTKQGELYVFKPRLGMPATEVRAFLFRLTRGLVWKFYPELWSLKPYLHFEYLSDPNEVNPMIIIAKTKISTMQSFEKGDGVFSCWHCIEGKQSMWIYSFYRGVAFMVLYSLTPHRLFDRQVS